MSQNVKLVMVALLPFAASAASITYEFQNVNLSNNQLPSNSPPVASGTITGNFEFDPVTGLYSNLDITVYDPVLANFPLLDGDPGVSTQIFDGPALTASNRTVNDFPLDNSSPLELTTSNHEYFNFGLFMYFDEPLGTNAVDTVHNGGLTNEFEGGGEYEPYIISGDVVSAAAPEPWSGILMGLGLLVLGAVRKSFCGFA